MTAGDIETDSVRSLDSLQRVERAQVLEQQRNEVTEAFIAQYEQKEHERLLLFDNASSKSVPQLYRPVRGVIMQSAEPEERQYALWIKTARNENVLSIMRGHVVLAERAEDNTYTLVVQHTPYMSIYRHVAKPLKGQGALVEAGEAIGVMDGEKELVFEIWDAGQFVNPEEVITW